MKILNAQNVLLGALAFALCLVIALAWLPSANASVNDQTTIARGLSASSTVATTGSTLVFATSTGNRVYGRITNDSATNKVYLSFGIAAAQGKGIALAPNTSFELTSENIFQGAIYAVASTSAVNLSTFEGLYR